MTVLYATPDKKVEINKSEVLRYLGYGRKAVDARVLALLDETIAEFESFASYKACYLQTDIKVEPGKVDFGAFNVQSRSLSKVLAGCGEAVLFAATAGSKVDVEWSRQVLQSPAKAVILDAAATAAIERWCDELCDRFEKDLQSGGLFMRPRFSPGYGDVPLEMQRPLLEMLDAGRKVGITLTNALLMTPKKSVSAIVGFSEAGCEIKGAKCELCQKANCLFRL